MRELLQIVEPTLWSQFSAVLFTMCFTALVGWIYWPKRKAHYDNLSKLPLNNDQGE